MRRERVDGRGGMAVWPLSKFYASRMKELTCLMIDAFCDGFFNTRYEPSKKTTINDNFSFRYIGNLNYPALQRRTLYSRT